jgi:choline dehydrogenase-like flavoprotein
MGTSQANSVVDTTLRSWDHENLYLAGGGAMPTIGTANVTLTLAALCLKSATHMINQLRRQAAPLAVSVR